MNRNMLRSKKSRGLLFLLALGLLPSPPVISWWLSQPREANAAVPAERAAFALTDVAPPQPVDPPYPLPNPRQRLRTLGATPDPRARRSAFTASAEERAAAHSQLAVALGGSTADSIVAGMDSPPPRTNPTASSPNLAPQTPDVSDRPLNQRSDVFLPAGRSESYPTQLTMRVRSEEEALGDPTLDPDAEAEVDLP